jgi:hypothetical protein
MLWFFILSCGEEKSEVVSGKELIDEYFSALCTWYSDQECSIEISQCGEPVTSYSDWAQCMNAQNNRINLCGQLPAVIEENPTAIQDCLSQLEQVECVTAEICPTTGHVLYDGVCGAVEETIIQECRPF